ncbi:hypothetical protein HanIR_Chr01g0026971 [Helianthus annuus]|nr:hypothetical protein HanIR_Chr01g0026971 [Helianthus annuus]
MVTTKHLTKEISKYDLQQILTAQVNQSDMSQLVIKHEKRNKHFSATFLILNPKSKQLMFTISTPTSIFYLHNKN